VVLCERWGGFKQGINEITRLIKSYL
jgi:hypothetical protein